MCDPVSLGVAALTAGASVYSAERGASSQRKAMRQAERQAQQQAGENDRAINRANQKQPNILGFLASNRMANASGTGSTMLTGPSGVMGGLPLGRTSLLGG